MFDDTRVTPLRTDHDFRWVFGSESVTVTCTRCKVREVFDLIAQWNDCISWCNEHSSSLGVPKVRVRKSRAKPSD